MAKGISLKNWIEEVGPKQVAKIFKVTPAAVRHWRCGVALPQTDKMQKIRDLSKGRVSYEEMIDTFHPTKKKN